MLLSKEENAILSRFACICNSGLAQILQNCVDSIRHVISQLNVPEADFTLAYQNLGLI